MGSVVKGSDVGEGRRGGGGGSVGGRGGGGGGGGRGGERSLFLPATKAVRGNNKHGEWCVSREALSRVSVRTGRGRGHKKERKGTERGETNDGD